MEDETKEKIVIYRVLEILARFDEPVSEEVRNFIECTATDYLELTWMERNEALIMKEAEADKILINLPIARKKQLYEIASKLIMIDLLKNKLGLAEILNSRRFRLFSELQKKYEIPKFNLNQ